MRPRRVSNRTRLALSFALFFAVLGLLSGVHAVAGDDPLSEQMRALFERSKGAVVKIEAADDHGKLSGTGFFVDPNGTLYTCYSVGGASRNIVVSHGELKYPATRLVADPRSGIAILKVEGQTPFLPLGKSKDLSVASVVLTIGYPMDLPVAPNLGVVAGFDTKCDRGYFVTEHIRANVPVQRGEGGAPMLNMNGDVVGILVSSSQYGAGCFALPIEAAEKVRQDFMRFGEMRPGWLGVKFGAALHETEGSGVRIENFVGHDPPAAKSGLEVGDVLLQIGDDAIKTPDDVRKAAFFLTAGDEVPITVWRHGQKISVKVEPGDHPDSPRETAALPSMPISTPAADIGLTPDR